MNWSHEAVTVWRIYAREFERRWGIDEEVAAFVGARSKQVFAAEFKEHGDKSYAESVVLPIRNAFYSATVIDARWKMLRDLGLTEPILDYGCGVGYQLLWLKRHGLSRLYAYDIPGIQHEVMETVMSAHGIPQWNGGKVGTVLCINVLEHVKEPVELLHDLQSIGKRVIANIDLSDDGPHIASHSELEKCRDILKESRTLYAAA